MSVEPPRELIVLAIEQRRSGARRSLYDLNDFCFFPIKVDGLLQAKLRLRRMILCANQHTPHPDLPGHQSETVLGIG